ncbi:1-deoxy-D-xylulose-5-phosphate synthase [Micromonospora humidisoli]|uniref:transketolase-like TK C-terminal-containing protein n=1 Tax=Micromonospora sp. AKA109 TaxID=2733865 RepID=UPI0022C46524|nr:transketolase C-terminal domain-containing protein [Micromonospora sp. AKA109]GHJ09762.1 1-deoxy-D-xylulose-5-phosphate synthase [Micromonospora sp. AKA109]
MNEHDLDVLDEIQRRVLWLATRIVDAANHDRDTGDGVKVGGHQASSASLVTAMTALWFAHLDAEDRVAVKPHASPVFHAIQYLLGNLDRSYLTRLRARGGLQSYPSRTKDPDEVDFSTGSVGLGAAAPLFAAVTRRYVDAHFGTRPHSRFVALIGDAELDEGNIWEAVADPATTGLGNVMWLVDFNRQSLDRVVPGIRIDQWRGQFEAAGWHVVEVKYGRRLAQAYARPGGAALRDWIDRMPNEQYQSLFGLTGPALRQQFLDGAPDGIAGFIADLTDEELAPLVTDLGGHDLEAMLDAYAQCDAVTDRPSVVFAYTVKGWGLPIAGNPRNHSALLSTAQVDALRAAHGLTAATEWDRLDPASPAGIRAGARREALARAPRQRSLGVTVPEATGVRTQKPVSTQEAFGRVLVELARDPQVAPYLVTTAPDVATSTNLAGFINRTGVFAPTERRSWSQDRMLRWTESPAGQHIELGISEMNLFLLLGQLGMSWDLSGQPLLPVGTVYDPFVLRGLDAFLYGTYSGSRFVVAGTPSGVTLAPEGGAHQSTITASVGLELPGVTLCEPAYATSLDWLLCDALGQIAQGAAPAATAAPAEDGAYYFRLSTRPLDQSPFEAARVRLGDAVLRRQVVAGAYRLVDAHQAHPQLADAPVVTLAASGAVLPETLAAAAELAEEGIAAHVVDVTSLDRLYRAWQRTLRQGVRTATVPSVPGALRAAFGDRTPLVTVHDAASHAMAWLGSALGVPAVPLGVDEFGQSGSVRELYELHDLLPGSIVNAALAALSLR